MPINNKKLCFWDIETGSLNPKECLILQVAAVIVNPKTLEIEESQTFNSLLRPLGEEKDWLPLIQKEALAVNGLTIEQIKNAPPGKQVWQSFISWLGKYKKPISCGKNIINFDHEFMRVMNEKCGIKTHPFAREIVDLDLILFNHFGHSDEIKKLNMDYIRDYMGIQKNEHHDALRDAKETAMVTCRFLKWYRKISHPDKFRNCFANKETHAVSN